MQSACVLLCYLSLSDSTAFFHITSKKTRLSEKKNITEYKIYVEIKCQLDATEVFIADLIA